MDSNGESARCSVSSDMGVGMQLLSPCCSYTTLITTSEYQRTDVLHCLYFSKSIFEANFLPNDFSIIDLSHKTGENRIVRKMDCSVRYFNKNITSIKITSFVCYLSIF